MTARTNVRLVIFNENRRIWNSTDDTSMFTDFAELRLTEHTITTSAMITAMSWSHVLAGKAHVSFFCSSLGRACVANPAAAPINPIARFSLLCKPSTVAPLMNARMTMTSGHLIEPFTSERQEETNHKVPNETHR